MRLAGKRQINCGFLEIETLQSWFHAKSERTQNAQRCIIFSAITYSQTSIMDPVIIVAIIASSFRRSKMMPVMPSIKDTGIEKIISSPPRAAIGSPQPGWSSISPRIVAPPMASIIAEITPKRIPWLFFNETIKVIYDLRCLV